MQLIDLKQILTDNIPNFETKYSNFSKKLIVGLLNKFLCVNTFNSFLSKNPELVNFKFIEAFFDYLNFKCEYDEEKLKNIPKKGPVIIVSNHPLGGLDGVALLLAISKVRPDVKAVVNHILLNMEPLKGVFLPFNVYSSKAQKRAFIQIKNAIENDTALLFFPSGTVSRLTKNGIKDPVWKRGAIQFAHKLKVPIVPIYVEGRNSLSFYLTALLSSTVSMLMLPKEVFKKRNKTIKLIIGDLIPGNTFDSINMDYQAMLLQKHLYRIGKNKKGMFKTVETIASPVNADIIASEIKSSKLLCQVKEDIFVYQVDFIKCPNVKQEIGRLREVTFRSIGEGTGKTVDTDIYDDYYTHIIVWNETEKDIMGSYRIGLCNEILEKLGNGKMYIDTMFELSSNFIELQKQSIELGRSFVAAKYWRSRALDYLWQGIGKFLFENPHIRYFYGTVSISSALPELAQSLIVAYYKKWYNGEESKLATANNKYMATDSHAEKIAEILVGEGYKKDFRNLKLALKELQCSLPVLYKRYTELCEYGGVKFIEWSVDEDFNNAIDGFVLVDMHKLRDDFKKRYHK